VRTKFRNSLTFLRYFPPIHSVSLRLPVCPVLVKTFVCVLSGLSKEFFSRNLKVSHCLQLIFLVIWKKYNKFLIGLWINTNTAVVMAPVINFSAFLHFITEKYLWYANTQITNPTDDGGSTDLWNVGKLIPVYTALQPRRQPSSYLAPWEPENTQHIVQRTTLRHWNVKRGNSRMKKESFTCQQAFILISLFIKVEFCWTGFV
jgi:hypothetical protein